MNHTEVINEQLGFYGRMLSGSKSGYIERYPEGKPIFNANIITSQGKVWYGDIDLFYDKEKLQNVADLINDTIYVLREMDARFDTEENPDTSKAVETFKPRD